jgi:hypothetical protein
MTMKHPRTSVLSALAGGAVALAIFLASSVTGAADATPATRAEVLTRVLSYERGLEDRVGPSVVLAVVYEPGDVASESAADTWLSAFKALDNVRIKGLPFSALKVAALEAPMSAAIDRDGVDILFVPEASERQIPTVTNVARKWRVLSAGSDESYASAGVTLAVATDGPKSKLVINLPSSAAEGIQFSYQVLKLATVIR